MKHERRFPISEDRQQWLITGYEPDGSSMVIPNRASVQWEYDSLIFGEPRPEIRVYEFNAADGRIRDVTDEFCAEDAELPEYPEYDRACSAADRAYDAGRV